MNDSKDHKAAAEPPLDCRVMPLAAQLRAHANSKNRTVAWESQARMLMKWAADVIDAANEALRHNASNERTPLCGGPLD